MWFVDFLMRVNVAGIVLLEGTEIGVGFGLNWLEYRKTLAPTTAELREEKRG